MQSFSQKFYCAYIRPIVEYASLVWSFQDVESCVLLENLQRRYIKHIAYKRNLTYKERLAALKLQSLQHRHLFNNLLQAFKSLHSFTVQPESLGLDVCNITMTRSCGRQFIHCKPKSNQLSKSFMYRLPIE